jgi:hypothetical protein
MVKNVRFIMTRMCVSWSKRHVQHGLNVSFSKKSDLAWTECVVVKNVRLGMVQAN